MRILWLKTELLHPVDKGGKIRTFHMLRELKRTNRITYLTLDDGDAAPDAVARAEEYCDELIRVPFEAPDKFTPRFYGDLVLGLLSPLPYFIAKYRSARMEAAIAERLVRQDIDVLICDFLVPSINLPEWIPCATVLFQHNVEAMIWKRHYKVQRNPVKKAFLRREWRKTRAYERDTCRRFDLVVAVSAEDRHIMQREYSAEAVVDVSTGVDTEYFRPSGEHPTRAHSLVFTGSMDWLPNDDAIRFFTEQILPCVREALPDVKLTVVGRNPTPALLALARRDPSVTVTGRVDDVRPFMERAAAYVIPLRIGGGTRLKVYEAMAMEKPVISTTVGAEGLPVEDGIELLLSDDPRQFADMVIHVLSDAEFARGLGERGAAKVREHFGWQGVAAEFGSVCENAARRHEQRTAAGTVLHGSPSVDLLRSAR